MASGMKPVQKTPQKHDPAWKHCEMFKNGDRTHLKCIYCRKIFKGGGIHRIKEHLAGQKGNAVTCLRVQADVRMQMLESLNMVAMKKRKKQSLAEEVCGYDNKGTNGVDSGGNDPCCFKSEMILLPVPEMVDLEADAYTNGEDGNTIKSCGRKKKERVRKAPDGNAVHMAIGRFFFHVGLPADAVNSVYFQQMVNAIASHGVGVVGPTDNDLRGWIWKNLVHEVRNDVDQCTTAWERIGCSVLVDEWISGKGKTFVNFFVNNPEGKVFLRSTNISHGTDSSDILYELLKETVEQVGLRNVVQVVTSGEDPYAVAGKRLTETYPTIFWSPCAGQCINLMLKDIGELPTVKVILDQAKSISRYMNSNSILINMLRRYTFGVDLLCLGLTRSSTDFMMLKRMVNIKHNLQSMFTSEEWMEIACSNKSKGLAVLDCINSESFWSKCSLITKLTDPLLRLLRIVNSEKKPAMGFVYAGLYRAKEAIKKELVTKEYMVYWHIIDHRWEHLKWNPLHAAGFYLNPKFFYTLEGDTHLHIRSLVYDCIEKLVPDAKVQDKIMKETTSYHGSTGDFGRKMAIRARDSLLPTEWWLTYGGGCPNLARFAIRILSQACCLIQHKLDAHLLERLQERKRFLDHQSLGEVMFVHYNMQMQIMRNQDTVDTVPREHIHVIQDWVMEDEMSMEGSDANCMTTEPPFGGAMLLDPDNDDIEALGTGFYDHEIFDGVKDNEEENGDANQTLPS